MASPSSLLAPSKKSSGRMPHCLAMATAVSLPSPVNISTRVPRVCRAFTAGLAVDRGGSEMPTTPTNFNVPVALLDVATARTRSPRLAMSDAPRLATSGSSASASAKTASSAPFTYRLGCDPGRSTTWTSIRFRSESNAISCVRTVEARRSATPKAFAATSIATSVGWPAVISAFEHRQQQSSAERMASGTVECSTSNHFSSSSPSSSRSSCGRGARRCATVCIASKRPSGRRLKRQPWQRTSVRVISFFVSVPVLSTHKTSVHPRASIAGNLFTTALRRAMRITPRASVTATQMGRPSGIAATAKETPT
mmetsp:Transcript_26418/g.88840  ORF Transcript_26418/g.88840 Transcript_26418/m.88840 type:complete len:310 (+) Transcript_26418:1365-2294(+)